jgi:hypothetical protein
VAAALADFVAGFRANERPLIGPMFDASFMDSKQAAETLLLNGESGEEIQLEIEVVSGIPNDLTIQATQGEEVLMDYSTTRGIPDTITPGFVVPRDGSVTITIGDASGAVSTLRVSITRTSSGD